MAEYPWKVTESEDSNGILSAITTASVPPPSIVDVKEFAYL